MPTASDYDSAWKDALEHYFPAFMGLLWPVLHARIDWAQAPVFRDKELHASRAAYATRADGQRLLRKTSLVRGLYHWGHQRDNVIRLFRIIDAMMALPEALESDFEDAIEQLEKETQMSYVTSVERVRLRREREEGKAEGKAEGFAALLSSQITRKFGALPDWAKVSLVAADEATLDRWAGQILDAQCIEDVFKR